MSKVMTAGGEIPSVQAIYGLPSWYIPAFKWFVVSVFGLICLGGSVRVMNAGLACPDWPLCFGDVIPDYHPQVYFEFIHRALAGLISIAFVILEVMLLRSSAPIVMKRIAVGTGILLLTQIVFGGLTVLLQLHSKVVAAHLGMGVGFFSLLLWQYLSLKNPVARAYPKWIGRVAVGLLLAVYGQILLGGLVASHFASRVCSDFPLCHGKFIPTLQGIIGLHVIHRLGAYTVFALILGAWWVLRKQGERVRGLSGWLLFSVLIQVFVGIANVLLHTPPLIAVVHLGVGTLVLSVCVRLLHETRGAHG